MSTFNRKNSRRYWAWIIVIFLINGCATREPSLEELSKSYQQNHNYESLVSILPYLNFMMTRAEVEELLGKPDGCFNFSESCQYVTTKTVIAYCPTPDVISQQSCTNNYLVLAVSYHLTDSQNSSPQDVLWRFSLSPVAE